MILEMLSELGLLSIEIELCESLCLSNIIGELANKKARRAQFNKSLSRSILYILMCFIYLYVYS
jgi:dolichol kinase